jgi:predicted GTPase
VYNTPDGHVTRDVREGVAKLGDMRFRVMDTAGLETSAETESVLARTAGITAAVLRDCQIALFLIDGRFLFLLSHLPNLSSLQKSA